MVLADLLSTLDRLVPLSYAESWDNVGLLVGDAAARVVGPVLLTIDLTEPVLAEAIAMKASVVIAYHPPIFEPLRRIVASSAKGRVVLGAIQHGVAVYSPHTALDAIPGGITDWLCEGLSGSGTPGAIAGDCRALVPHAALGATQEVKIVTFVPAGDVSKVRSALASAGAGLIGHYSLCAFASSGTGSFVGDASTHPAVGQPGHLEEHAETRLEMVCSTAALPLALETLREFHPYEEPAIDVYPLVAQPQRRIGAGRRVTLDQPATLATLAQRLKAHLGIGVVNIVPAPGRPADHPIKAIGVVPGSGASLVAAASANHCDAFVTGEMKHHEVLGALERGIELLLAGHTNTERGYLPRLATRLTEARPGLMVKVSQADRSPRVPV
jgi:dinuclear metal center YbgI/SA1388 family protein